MRTRLQRAVDKRDKLRRKMKEYGTAHDVRGLRKTHHRLNRAECRVQELGGYGE